VEGPESLRLENRALLPLTFTSFSIPLVEVVQPQGIATGPDGNNRRDGSWTLTSHHRLSDGTYAVTASQTGETGPPSVLYSLEPDSSGNLSNARVIDTLRAAKRSAGQGHAQRIRRPRRAGTWPCITRRRGRRRRGDHRGVEPGWIHAARGDGASQIGAC
jgi:hypothetical protein